MTRKIVGGAILAAAALGAAMAGATDDAPKPTNTRIADLDWLAGRWLGTFDGGQWEVCYTTPAGGEILGVNKEIRGDKVAMIEFERFRTVDGRVTVTPYPFGRQAEISFPLAEHDAHRAVFTNPDHDFPQRITYHRVADDRLQIEALGQRGEQEIRLNINLQRIN